MSECARMQVDDVRAGVLVASGLSQLHASISHVDLSFNVISDVGARAVGTLLSRCPTLTTVTLIDNNIRAAGARALAHRLAADTCALRSLDLRLNYIGDEGAVELCRVLTLRNRTLTSLNISSNLCTSASASALADMLLHNDIITAVDITCNSLGVSNTPFHFVFLSVCQEISREFCVEWDVKCNQSIN